MENVSTLAFASPTRKSTGRTMAPFPFLAAGDTRSAVVRIEPPANATDATDPPLPLPMEKSLL